jgi:hypothetical protein
MKKLPKWATDFNLKKGWTKEDARKFHEALEKKSRDYNMKKFMEEYPEIFGTKDKRGRYKLF